MQRTTHFEQVPLKAVEAILKAEREQALTTEIFQAETELHKPQPRVERKA